MCRQVTYAAQLGEQSQSCFAVTFKRKKIQRRQLCSSVFILEAAAELCETISLK